MEGYYIRPGKNVYVDINSYKDWWGGSSDRAPT
jgi:hypothetical protein